MMASVVDDVILVSDDDDSYDITKTFNEVENSFVIQDSRKSLGKSFCRRDVIEESSEDDSESGDENESEDEYESENESEDERVLPVPRKNVRRLINSSEDEDFPDPSPEHPHESRVDSNNDGTDASHVEEGSKSDVSPTDANSSVISISSDEDDYVQSPQTTDVGKPMGASTPRHQSSAIARPAFKPPETEQPARRKTDAHHTNQKPVVPSPTNQKPVVPSPTNQKPVVPSPTNQKPVVPSPTNQKPVVPSPTNQKPVVPSPTNQKPVVPLPTNQKPVVPSPTNQKPLMPGSYEAALARNTVAELRAEIGDLRSQYAQVKSALKNSAASQLPDGGQRLRSRLADLSDKLLKLDTRLAMQLSLSGDSLHSPSTDSGAGPSTATVAVAPVAVAPQWNAIRNTNDIQHGFGAKAMESHTAERTAVLALLSGMHGLLDRRPGETEMANQPRGLRKGVELMPHQRRALAWLRWREATPNGAGPKGGILADDMGLGKTLTMISLMLKHREEFGSDDDEDDQDDDDDVWTTTKSKAKKSVQGGTLIVCPASLLSQWEGEVRRRCKADRVAVEVHHGPGREKRGYRLARRPMVVTTYAIARTEHASRGALHQVHWQRIVLDEAHVVRNHKSKTAEAVFGLKGRHRWCLTGTPVHNKELDLFALIKFIGCYPLDDVHVWKRWIDNKATNGAERLHLLLDSLLLRRTKDQLQASNELQGLGTKEMHVVHVSLTEQETAVYDKILAFSKSMFAKFLLQRHEREANQNNVADYQPLNLHNLHELHAFEPGSRLAKMADKYATIADVKAHEILVLLLRLRQICVHPSLVTSMLDNPTLEPANDDEGDELAGALGNLRLGDRGDRRDEDDRNVEEDEFWTQQNPVFDDQTVSSKMRAVLDTLLREALDSGTDKAVVVSQWVSMLGLLETALIREAVPFVKLCGATDVRERMRIVEEFNDPHSDVKVMLLSLTAGGVGLNLVGANHLLLCDLHWNPQLEAQACDRVFRVGQTKQVHIYKFVCKETIEEHIQALQEKKLAIATNVLTGARDSAASKLTIDDMKMLFNM